MFIIEDGNINKMQQRLVQNTNLPSVDIQDYFTFIFIS